MWNEANQRRCSFLRDREPAVARACRQGSSRSRVAILIGTAVLVAASLAGCGGSSSASSTPAAAVDSGNFLINTPFQATGTPVHGGTLVFAMNQSIVGFNIFVDQDLGSSYAQELVFAGLVTDSPSTTAPQPALAASWTISPSGLVYTFHLRPGIRFSNGQAVTPGDVQYTLNTAKSAKLDPGYSSLFSTVKSVVPVGSSDVRVTLSSPTPAFLAYLTTTPGLIVPESIVKSEGFTKFGLHPVGAGPFEVKSFSPNGPQAVFGPNPYYYKKGLPYVSRLDLTYVPDDSTRMLDVQSGSADIAEGVPFSQVAEVNNAPGVKVVTQHLPATDLIWINYHNAPLSNVDVREALQAATPQKTIVNVVFHGYAAVANTGDMPTAPRDASLAPPTYSVARAKGLLAAAGYSKGFPLTATIQSGDTVTQQLMTILQSAWRQIGIQLSVKQVSSGALQTAVTSTHNYQIAAFTPLAQVANISLNDQWDEYWTYYDTSLAHDPQAIALVKQATTTDNQATRTRDFAAFQRIFQQNTPVIALVYPANLFAVRTNVHNFVTTVATWNLDQVWLSH